VTRPGASPVEATQITPYLGFLFVLLSTATLFEGFDSAMLTVAAPDARAALDISREEWSYLFAFNRLGMVVSFFLLLFADRWGRRNLLMLTVVGFAVFNGLTAFATDKYEFAIYQFLSRIFLTSEYALAVIVIGEEFPARLRGFGIAVLTSLATVGVMLVARVQPYVLLEPGAPDNWLHSLGMSAVEYVQLLLGRPADGESWRALYVLGTVPLLLVLLLRFGMRETRRFDALRAEAAPRQNLREQLRDHMRSAAVPWKRVYRRRTAIVAVLWNCVHIVTAPAVAFWVIYAREDLGLTPSDIGGILFWGYGGGFAGHFVAGLLIERIGRKWTCSGFYVAAAIAIFWLFQTRTLPEQYVWMFLTVFSFGAAGTATHVYASELFPTEIRATGYGWTTNLIGRATEVGTPLVIGLLIESLGISWSVGVVAFGPILGAVVVLLYAPETRGLTLEQVQEQLGEGAKAA
jgi:putative MFS transporter